MNFGQAIEALKLGKRVAREGWNGKGMHIELYVSQKDDYLPCDYIPWIRMFTVDRKYVPWLASQTDMLAEDWSEV